MDYFQLALNFTLPWEGGFSNRKNDRGGATNKGIIQATYDNYRIQHHLSLQSVKFITEPEVFDIYKSMFWDAGNCDDTCSSFSPRVAIAQFDWSVNSGVGIAQRYLVPDYLAYLQRRDLFLERIVQNDPTQLENIVGWHNRVEALRTYLSNL